MFRESEQSSPELQGMALIVWIVVPHAKCEFLMRVGWGIQRSGRYGVSRSPSLRLETGRAGNCLNPESTGFRSVAGKLHEPSTYWTIHIARTGR